MWVKICGVRDAETARMVAACGADAVGLNFYPKSPRSISATVARTILAHLPPEIEAVGLFVNPTVEEFAAVCRGCRLPTAQLHGDETPERLAEFQRAIPEVRLIRVFRLPQPDLTPVAEYLQDCRERGVRPAACLVDACIPGTYGGTGHTAPWPVLADGWRDEWPPLVLAGGLTPANVAEAIRAVRPWGVDVASGVESSLGVKNRMQVALFVEQARLAAASLPNFQQG